jgi:putative flavoprotein involved in K+ transport
VIAASGTFGRPYRPDLPGLDSYTVTLLHAADYRPPEPFTGQGLEWRRSLSSNSLRGVGRGAARVARHLAAHPAHG